MIVVRSQVIDQQSTQTVLTLENELGTEGKYCMPFNVSFSPDEKHMAVCMESP